ncbi:GNAT family N-acetyltransferase [Mariprofundus sp. KV]|uniref:GNAT family N-acetyltransferase n=1 Tax=Mariprofundus sp. KV TaxID=2608715 RepID=UPI0015A14B5F|nr:GNAT family N-acetyltransferase [Mariprofundus sp. KV]NWF35776.1 GNAT family N-acetyltransferase [Mariprofundus sp. KV]
MVYEVRLAVIDDIEAIAELGAITFAKAYGDIVLASDMQGYLAEFFDPERLKQEIGSKSASYFVAESQEGVVGYAKLAETDRPAQLADERVIELIRLYVRPGNYGMGIGGKLLQAVKQYARSCGYSGLWLRVWEENSGAIRMYERDGFRQLGSEPYYIGTTPNPVVLMVNKQR